MKKIVLTLLSLLILGTSAAQAETVVFNVNIDGIF
ncbi:unknown [Brachyspira sp. CAG:484]|nr:unknown [Brachyspira sp. CAG:484]